MDRTGSQAVSCSVNTCQHYEDGNHCCLSQIEICSDGFLTNAKTAKQSMCSSFEGIS